MDCRRTLPCETIDPAIIGEGRTVLFTCAIQSFGWRLLFRIQTMAQVVSLCSLGGTNFSIIPTQLVECTDEESTRLIELGMARALIKGEPSELQLATLQKLPSVQSNEQSQANGESTGATSTAKAPAAKPSRPKSSKSKPASSTPADGQPQTSDVLTQQSLIDGVATSDTAGPRADDTSAETQSSDSDTAEQS